MRAVLLLFACTLTANAQWQILDGHTTADLRGIDSVGNGIVWASGSNGTVLRTEDNGKTWQHCTTPPDAEKLDFRGVQAFDGKTAIVMSSGKGDLSRLYKTADGCQTWKLVFTNPDKDGFWDAIKFFNGNEAIIIGDPVRGHFSLFRNEYVRTDAEGWKHFAHSVRSPTIRISPPHTTQEGLFAASNSVLIGDDQPAFVTGGAGGSFYYGYKAHKNALMSLVSEGWFYSFLSLPLPLARGESAGAFSVAERRCQENADTCAIVVVGGDYKLPDKREGTAAYGIVGNPSDVPKQFEAPATLPGGYRSAVAYDQFNINLITVGPNGTDISTDDGRNWRALRPGAGDAADADKNWNALSLPFVVGPNGRIGVLEVGALKGTK
jgi:hypothetical protein